MSARDVDILRVVREIWLTGEKVTYRGISARSGYGVAQVHGAVRKLGDAGFLSLKVEGCGHPEIRPRDEIDPRALEGLTPAGLRNAAAMIAGRLAHEQGGYETAEQYRRIAQTLLRPHAGERAA